MQFVILYTSTMSPLSFAGIADAPHTDTLGLMKLLSNISFSCSFNNFNFVGVILYSGIDINWAFYDVSIDKNNLPF